MTEKKAVEAFTVHAGMGPQGWEVPPTTGVPGPLPFPFRPAPVLWAQDSALGPQIPGRQPKTTPDPWLHPENTWLLEGRPSANHCLSFPSAEVELRRQQQILLAHLKDKETEAQGILQL